MTSPCSSFERFITREADAAPLTADERQLLDAHLQDCTACRLILDEQRQVAGALHARLEVPVRPGFSARLAERLDREDEGMLGLANWRAWTFGLAPLAAALVLAAYVGAGAGSTSEITQDTVAATETVSPFESWISSSAGSTPASVFLQPTTSGEVLLETVLTGSVPATASEERRVR